jgi:hypothetical protein
MYVVPMKMLSVLFLSAIAANPSAANAVDIYTRYFTGVSGGKPCYARYYDRAHLNAHPKQTVRRIEVYFDQDRRDDKVTKNTSADFQASFGFMLKRSHEWYEQELFCKVAADHFDCYLDADGGKFHLTPEGDGLRLEVTGGGGGTDQIVAEGTDWGEFGAPGGDDRVFILRRADRKLCSAANAD